MAETIFYSITTKPFPLLALIKQKRLSVLYVFLLKDAFGMDCLKNYYNIMRILFQRTCQRFSFR